MITQIILLISWPVLIIVSYYFVKMVIKKFEARTEHKTTEEEK